MNHDQLPAFHPFYRRSRRHYWLLIGLIALTLGVAMTVRPSAAKNSASGGCHDLTRSLTGQGDNPTASPTKSEGCDEGNYTAGQVINLTAAPAAGWHVSGWSGTADNSSTATTNTVTMPDEDHTVGVTYAEDVTACYALTLSHGGEGADPTAAPPNSTGCPAGEYTAEQVINLTADPADGWRVKNWSGTINNNSTATDNTVTMPAADHEVKVTYENIPIPSSFTFLPVILQDWPQWEEVGETHLTSLYTVGVCPSGETKRFAATRDALYRWESGDWEIMPGAPANVRDFLFLDACAVYAASFNGGVWRLDEQNQTWQRIGTDALPAARSLARRDEKLYVGSRDGVARYDTTSQPAAAWEPVLTGSNVTRLSRAGERLYAADFGLGARFNDACDDTACAWPEVGDAPFGDAFDVAGSAAGAPTEWVVLATARGLYRWDGSAWSQPSAPPQPAGNVFALAVVGDWVYAGVQNGGVWVSRDLGDTWALFEESPIFTIIDLVVVSGDGLYAVTPNEGVWRWPLP